MRKFFKQFWPVFTIAVLVFIIAWQNYQPGTWLLGWDNLVPEFNFALNIKRSIFSAWQEYQGLGLAGGMGHGASLPRQLILWAFSLVIPTHFLRYFWTFLMLFSGSVGAYTLSFYLNRRNKTSIQKTASLMAALVYLLNLATVQYFFTPFETFSSFYGFLPWLIWAGLRYLDQGGWKKITSYFLISLLATPAFQVQTLFVVYMMVMLIFIVGAWIKKGWAGFGRSLAYGFVTLLANLFWLFPVAYFTITSSHVNIQAKQNQISTPELRIMNQNFGDIEDISLLRGYWFEYLDKQGDTHDYLMADWRNHLQNNGVTLALRIIFVLGLLGILAKVIRTKGKEGVGWLFGSILIIIILSSGKGAIGYFYGWLENMIPLFRQIFRTTFTKWSVVMALFLAIGSGFLFAEMGRFLKKWLYFWAMIIFSGLLIFGVYPIFKGDLIYSQTQVDFPQEYLELFDHFKTQPKQARIAIFPPHSLWSWNFYDWGYRGSGFLWYGIEQPILSRSFDMFSQENENFYHQIAEANDNGSIDDLEMILNKYDVSYLLIDRNLNGADEGDFKLKIDHLEEKLKVIGYQESYANGLIQVLVKKNLGNPSFVTALDKFSVIGASNVFQAKHDPVFADGDYAFSEKANKWYPFMDFIQQDLRDVARYVDGNLEIYRKVNLIENENYKFVIPGLVDGDFYGGLINASYLDDKLKISFPAPVLYLDQEEFSLPTLPSIEVGVPTDYEEVWLSINGQGAVIEKGQEKKLRFFQFQVGDPLVIETRKVVEKKESDEVETAIGTTKAKRLDEEIWQPIKEGIDFPVEDNVTELLLKIPLGVLVLENDLEFKKEVTSCDVFKRGNTTKTFLDTGEVEYLVDGSGAICESLELVSFSPKGSYVVYVEGENFSGRPPKLSVASSLDNSFFVEDLLDEKGFFGTYLLPSNSYHKDERYFLNFEFKSFGEDLSANTIRFIELGQMPFDAKYLANFSITTKQEMAEKKNMIKLGEVNKKATWWHQVEVSVPGDEAMLGLSQGFNEGWIAIRAEDSSNFLPHYMINSWSNGWLVPSGEYQINIFYWPQLGVFVGFGLVGLTSLVFLLSFILKRLLASDDQS